MALLYGYRLQTRQTWLSISNGLSLPCRLHRCCSFGDRFRAVFPASVKGRRVSAHCRPQFGRIDALALSTTHPRFRRLIDDVSHRGGAHFGFGLWCVLPSQPYRAVLLAFSRLNIWRQFAEGGRAVGVACQVVTTFVAHCFSEPILLACRNVGLVRNDLHDLKHEGISPVRQPCALEPGVLMVASVQMPTVSPPTRMKTRDGAADVDGAIDRISNPVDAESGILFLHPVLQDVGAMVGAVSAAPGPSIPKVYPKTGRIACLLPSVGGI